MGDAVLFSVFLYAKRRKRERKQYTATLMSLTDSLKCVEGVKAICDEMCDTQTSFHDEHQTICNKVDDLKEEVRRLWVVGGVK